MRIWYFHNASGQLMLTFRVMSLWSQMLPLNGPHMPAPRLPVITAAECASLQCLSAEKQNKYGSIRCPLLVFPISLSGERVSQGFLPFLSNDCRGGEIIAISRFLPTWGRLCPETNIRCNRNISRNRLFRELGLFWLPRNFISFLFCFEILFRRQTNSKRSLRTFYATFRIQDASMKFSSTFCASQGPF